MTKLYHVLSLLYRPERIGEITTIYRNHGAFVDGHFFARRDDLGRLFGSLRVGQKVRYCRTMSNAGWHATDVKIVE